MAKLIDLYSDTVTKPSAGMYAAMQQAAVGDDQRGDDPSAADLQARVAEMLGQQAALIFPSATMANQVAIMIQTRAGDQVLCHHTAHVYNFEGGGIGGNAGAQVTPLEGERGTFTGAQLEAALHPDDPHFSASRLVVVENTSNLGGGTVWPDDDFDAVVRTCRRHGLSLHIDGARLFNAAVACNRPASHWARAADTVQVCFSKGLGCPFGAVLAGSEELMQRARRVRQRLGGAWRQVGVLAGAMNYALDHHVSGLERDHQRLQRMVEALGKVEGLLLEPAQTNILLFRHRALVAADFAAALRERGVWLSFHGQHVRACTHLDLSDEDVDRAIAIISQVAGEGASA